MLHVVKRVAQHFDLIIILNVGQWYFEVSFSHLVGTLSQRVKRFGRFPDRGTAQQIDGLQADEYQPDYD